MNYLHVNKILVVNVWFKTMKWPKNHYSRNAAPDEDATDINWRIRGCIFDAIDILVKEDKLMHKKYIDLIYVAHITESV